MTRKMPHPDYSSYVQVLEHVNVDGEAWTTCDLGHLRNLGGIASPALWQHTYSGTKDLIENYVHEVVRQLYMTARSNDPQLDLDTKRAFFSEMLQSFGRTVLILHGGASFGLCHLGVVKALYQADMLPKIICGSYIGALVASLICTQTPQELERVLNSNGINFQAFYKTGRQASFRRKLVRLLKHGRLFDIRVLEDCARSNIGDITFREAYQKSGLILNISVYAKRKHEVPVLLNYLTAPDLIVWTAACASCVTPGIYDPVVLLAKHENGTIYPWPASAIKLESARMVQEVPVKRLTELFNVNNFIVSQVPSYFSWKPNRSERSRKPLIWWIMNFMMQELAHRFNQLNALGLIPRFVMNMIELLKSPIVGDIQITPTIYCSDIQYLLSNPTPEFVKYCIQKGSVATWRRLSAIQTRCMIEFALEDILQNLTRKDGGPVHGSQGEGIRTFPDLSQRKALH